MKFFILYIACFFMLLSCQTPLKIAGTYSSRKDLNKFELYPDSTFIYTSLRYKGSPFINKHSDGRWRRIDKNTVVFNSRIRDNIIPLQIEKINTSDSLIQICQNLVIIQKKSWPEYKDEDFLVTPYIEGNNYLDLHPELSDEPLQITKNEFRLSLGLEPDTINSSEVVMVSSPVKRGSYCIYPKKPFSSIFFEIEKRPKTVEYRTFYRLKTEKVNIPVQFGDSLSINIVLNDSLFSYRIFDNEILKLKGKKLIFKDSEDNNKTNKLLIK